MCEELFMLYVTHSQVDAEAEFRVVSLILILFLVWASIKWFLAFCKFLENAKDCWLLLSDILTYTVRKVIVLKQLPTLHCTVMGFALDWESHKSLKHDRERLTELLERAFFQPYVIQRIQLAEVDWESDNKGFDWKRCCVCCRQVLPQQKLLYIKSALWQK